MKTEFGVIHTIQPGESEKCIKVYPSRGNCDFCGKYFSKLSQHITDIHEKIIEECDICGKMVARRSIFKHKELHNKVECTACGLFFTDTFLRLKHPKRCENRKINKFIVQQ